MHLGQNLAVGASSWDDAIQEWVDDRKGYSHGIGNINRFTQVSKVVIFGSSSSVEVFLKINQGYLSDMYMSVKFIQLILKQKF